MRVSLARDSCSAMVDEFTHAFCSRLYLLGGVRLGDSEKPLANPMT